MVSNVLKGNFGESQEMTEADSHDILEAALDMLPKDRKVVTISRDESGLPIFFSNFDPNNPAHRHEMLYFLDQSKFMLQNMFAEADNS